MQDRAERGPLKPRKGMEGMQKCSIHICGTSRPW